MLRIEVAVKFISFCIFSAILESPKVVSATVLDNWPRLRRESLVINEQTPREVLCAWMFIVDNSRWSFSFFATAFADFKGPWQPQKRRKCKHPLNWSVLGEASSTSGHQFERNFLLPITLERKFLGNNALVPFSSFLAASQPAPPERNETKEMPFKINSYEKVDQRRYQEYIRKLKHF